MTVTPRDLWCVVVGTILGIAIIKKTTFEMDVVGFALFGAFVLTTFARIITETLP